MNFFRGKRSSDKEMYKAYLLLLLLMPFYFLSHAQSQLRSELAIQLLLNTNGDSENTVDGVVAFFDDSFLYSIGNEDSYKFTNPDENLAIDCRGTLVSINGQPGIQATDTLKIVMWQLRQKSYYLKLTGRNFRSGVKAVVKDNYLHEETSVDLSSVTLLHFGITADPASFAKDRFAIVFKTIRALPLSSASKINSVFKENSSLSVFLHPVAGKDINVQMIEMKKGRYIASMYSNTGEMVYSGFISHDGSAAVKTIVTERRIRKGIYNFLLTHKDVTVKKRLVFE